MLNTPSAAEVLEERPMTKGNSEKTDCELHAEAEVSSERTEQDT